MKRIFSFLIPFLLIANVAAAAISSGTVFESRTTATASMVNGGGFNPLNPTPGTDYSQSDTAQYNFTDLASTVGTTNPCVVTSASHNFVDADEGNIIHIPTSTGNWLPGWYEIVSTAGNAATLDRACGSAASISGATYYVGGALSWNSTLDDDFFDSFVTANGGITVWFKLGAFSNGEAITVPSTAGGTAAKPNRFIGYKTTRGDLDVNDVVTDRPVINPGANNFSYSTAPYWHVENLNFVGTGTNVITTGLGTGVKNVRCVNLSTTADRGCVNPGNFAYLENVDAASIRGDALIQNGQSVTVVYSQFHDSKHGINWRNSTVMSDSIFYGNITAAINNTNTLTATRSVFKNNTLYGAENKRGLGMSLSSTSNPAILLNNIFYGFTTANSSTDTPAYNIEQNFNLYYNNTTNYSNAIAGGSDYTSSDPGFTAKILLRTGSTATVSGSVITQTGATFDTWGIEDATNGVPKHFVRLVSGTGVTTGMYGISSKTATTLTVNAAPGNSVAGDVVWEIVQITGTGFDPNYSVTAKGYPPVKLDSYSRSWVDIGAVQRNPQMPRRR